MSTGKSRQGRRARREPRNAGREADRVGRKMDQAARNVEDAKRKIEQAERTVERELERAQRQIEEAAGPIWGRPEPGARRARFTREQIAEAALAVADKEGFDAVSMRRVATELGAGTMTLYHYVRTKDELIALMDDAIMGELLIPDGEMPSGWREALTLIARRTRDAFERHPWSLQSMGGAQMGPNSMQHVEQSVAAVASLDLDVTTTFEIIGFVDEYVFGYAMRRHDPGPEDPDARGRWLNQVTEYIDAELATGDYPHLEKMVPKGGMAAVWELMQESDAAEERFERGLTRLLDGIELELEGARARRSPPVGAPRPSKRSSTPRRT